MIENTSTIKENPKYDTFCLKNENIPHGTWEQAENLVLYPVYFTTARRNSEKNISFSDRVSPEW